MCPTVRQWLEIRQKSFNNLLEFQSKSSLAFHVGLKNQGGTHFVNQRFVPSFFLFGSRLKNGFGGHDGSKGFVLSENRNFGMVLLEPIDEFLDLDFQLTDDTVHSHRQSDHDFLHLVFSQVFLEK